jgi:iron transport multicopper oxidase
VVAVTEWYFRIRKYSPPQIIVLMFVSSGIPTNGGEATYQIAINASGQHGTYWVHSHAPGQYTDGLRAPLVIHATKEPYTYDDEYTVVLGDWYHQLEAVLIKQYITPSNPTGVEPVPG